MCWKESDYKEIEKLKRSSILELPWDLLEDDEVIWKYEKKKLPIAYLRLSPDPKDKSVIWIDEFEVIREYRGQGLGKKVISDFLDEIGLDVKLMAKNKGVQLFWEKCGFEDDGITWAEIPMIYKRKRQYNHKY